MNERHVSVDPSMTLVVFWAFVEVGFYQEIRWEKNNVKKIFKKEGNVFQCFLSDFEGYAETD
jgi:hypothetical protein